MNDLQPAEEKALAYLLGEMGAEERRAFEADLEVSEELRGRVRELEEGAVAVARACPKKKVPASVWKAIESEIGSGKRIVVLDWEWWRGKGWWAAAACLALLLAYSVHVRVMTREGAGSNTVAQNAAPGSDQKLTRIVHEKEEAVAEAQRADKARQEEADRHVRETAALRNQVAELQQQMAGAAQTLGQQQALLSDPARMKFVGLAPVSGAGTNMAGLSPRLQRALFLAMARELGWLGNSNQVFNASPDGASANGKSNPGGVDFVDLRAGTNIAQKLSVNIPQPGNDTTTAASENPTGSPGTLPAYATGDHVTVALDDSVAPAGSQVTLTVGTTGGTQTVVGTVLMGSNPTVIAIPMDTTGVGALVPASASHLDGWMLTVGATSANGGSNVFQFIAVPGP